VRTKYINLDKVQNYTWIEKYFEMAGYNLKVEKPHQLKLNVFHHQFLRTCTACISLSLAQVILNLPYAVIEVTNQFLPNLHLINSLQYVTYSRYLFYGIKFYLLYLVSALFRKEFKEFFKKNIYRRRSKLLKLQNDEVIQPRMPRQLSI